MCLYYDLNRTKQSKDHLQYMYTVYKNDVPAEDYAFGSELILEYVNAAAAAAKLHQHQPDGQNPKQQSGKKNRRRSRDKKGAVDQLAGDKQRVRNQHYQDELPPGHDPWLDQAEYNQGLGSYQGHGDYAE